MPAPGWEPLLLRYGVEIQEAPNPKPEALHFSPKPESLHPESETLNLEP